MEKQHIDITPGICGGKARIAGHRVKVQNIVIWTEQGQSPDEIVARIPSLQLADVHAALAYYYDNKSQIDQEIREDQEFLAEIQQRRTAV